MVVGRGGHPHNLQTKGSVQPSRPANVVLTCGFTVCMGGFNEAEGVAGEDKKPGRKQRSREAEEARKPKSLEKPRSRKTEKPRSRRSQQAGKPKRQFKQTKYNKK